MGLETGKKYKDGWGAEQTVGGVTAVNPDWVWTIQGNWYRQSDGRYVGYRLIDPSRPNGPARHVVAEKRSNWDLVID